MRFFWILLCLLGTLKVTAQKLQTIVPARSVVIGTAFQVQYVVLDPSELSGFTPPVFEHFDIVSGPNHYRGNAVLGGRVQAIENITYTLVPRRTGKLIVKGLRVGFKSGLEMNSDDVVIEVVPPLQQSFSTRSSYTDAVLYGAASPYDVDRVINKNLFIRAEVSKKNCYVGEAITASFKLYSRLQSSSELVRVPSLYGFSVIDVLNIKEAHQAVETIDGKVFNTSILRQVQLYPEQAGKLVIDEMVLKNEIEFDDSLENDKKTVIGKELRSRPIEINVRALPSPKPALYTGAVGSFSISAALDSPKMEVNHPASFRIRITGSGNFMQMSEPVVDWPEGVEFFEPVIKDELNTSKVPAEGVRTYVYQVSADSSGVYRIPPVSFSYFNPATDSFKTIQSASFELEVTPMVSWNKEMEIVSTSSNINYWPWLLAVLAAGLLVLFFKKKKAQPVQEIVEERPPAVSEKCRALDLDGYDDKQACIQVNKLLTELQRLYPSITRAQQQELESIRNDCQLLAYSNVETTGKKENLKNKTLKLALEIEAGQVVDSL